MQHNGACQYVLVVENEPSLARGLRRALCRVGYSVEIALSCKAATTMKRSFDVGVFDVELGDGCGVDLAKTLLDTGRLCRLVFFTASMDRRIHELARPLGPIVSKRDGIPALLDALSASVPPHAR